MKTIEEIIKEYKNSVEKIVNKKNDLHFVFNKDWYKDDYSEIKYIVVGDNPGKMEVERKRYFIGSSGKILRKFFSEKLAINSFDKEVLVFNKTPIYSDKTKDLNSIKGNHCEYFNSILELSANMILRIQKDLGIPILIFGHTNLKKVFKVFLDKLKDSKDYEMIKIYNHPASRQHWYNQWKNFSNETADNRDLFLKIGEKRRTEIMKK